MITLAGCRAGVSAPSLGRPIQIRHPPKPGDLAMFVRSLAGISQPATHLLCFCLVLLPALAQQTTPLEPELMNVVYVVDPSDRTLKPLPKELGVTDTKLGLVPIKAHTILRV